MVVDILLFIILGESHCNIYVYNLSFGSGKAIPKSEVICVMINIINFML